MSSSNFVHLHAHSEYSLLDGAARLTDDHGNPSAFLKAMAQSGMPALALTDHGNMFGAIEFYEGCKSVGLNPIIGCEAYMAPHSRLDRKGQSEKEATRHITLLSKNLAGYRNLMQLLSKAYLEGFYYKPRIDKELLSQHAEGIVALSGCLKGEVAQALLAGDRDGAENLIGTYRSILGPDNFYLELMDHGLEKQQRVNKELVDIAKRGEIPLVATNDCHYFRKEDAPAHDVLLCIGTGKRLDEPNRLRYEAPEFYYKSSAEMAKLFSYAPQALRATVEIAEKCSTEIPLHQMLLPHFETPAGESVESCLEKLCWEGLKRLKLDALPEYARRLRYELGIIFKMGYASYFLIVRDFIDYARRNQVPVGPGRGSGAGSLVAYSLAITMVDPIRYGLLFERFLNPDRRSMPDLDIDFSDEGRERVIEYVRGKYGMHNVAQIITFGTMQARLVVRDVGRVLGVPLPEVDRLAKLIPAGVGIAQALETIPELKEAAQSNSQAKKLLSLAQKLEGLKRHTGVHAAGIVITKEAVHCYSPLAKSGNQGVITTQYSDVNLLKLGLLKMDFLGLRTLTIVDHACKMIRLKKNPEFDVMKIPLDDAKTYAMLREGNAFGVFQLESSGMRDLLRRLKPATFEDISATIALYRPGPMQSGMLDDFVERKNGNKKVTYAHRLLEPILKETCGAMIYQEQIMEIAKAMALFTPGQADGLRKAMGKKIIEEMQSTRQLFVDGCERNKISSKLANKVYDQIEKFGGYGFNKSHTVAYGLVTYQTAYLKANYPIEYVTALLTSEIGRGAIDAEGRENKIVSYMEQAKSMGLAVLPPDVQRSEGTFCIVEDQGAEKILFGLLAVKNVGSGAVESILRARKAEGPFKSLDDFCRRVDLRQANKKVVESMVKAGALDRLLPGTAAKLSRARMLESLAAVMDRAGKVKQDLDKGQGLLFESAALADPEAAAGEVRPLSERDILEGEREVLGFYLSGHPLNRYRQLIKKFGARSIGDLDRAPQAKTVSLAGMITQVSHLTTKATGAPWARVKLEDLTGEATLLVFPRAYAAGIGKMLRNQQIVLAKGRLSGQGEEAAAGRKELIVEELLTFEEALGQFSSRLAVQVPASARNDKTLYALRGIFSRYPGRCTVVLNLETASKESAQVVTEERVKITQTLLDELEALLGDGVWQIESAY
ncbi:MAG: DNA polymerase III subunit alpha [Elusimicrobia bacterium RIFCSPLOWO2_12_FULL_59_9]|nr:MAG: DNA polymerase III subunit alpha [Elusimicrobia bacterium RIFCSPLOWO2_12_FULL_59_9]